jgi:hypothetical protein
MEVMQAQLYTRNFGFRIISRNSIFNNLSEGFLS